MNDELEWGESVTPLGILSTMKSWTLGWMERVQGWIPGQIMAHFWLSSLDLKSYLAGSNIQFSVLIPPKHLIQVGMRGISVILRLTMGLVECTFLHSDYDGPLIPINHKLYNPIHLAKGASGITSHECVLRMNCLKTLKLTSWTGWCFDVWKLGVIPLEVSLPHWVVLFSLVS